MQEFVLFGKKEQTDVIWVDNEGNHFYIHRVMLELKCNTFRDIQWDEKTTVITTTFSKDASHDFLKLLYFNELYLYELRLVLDVYKICIQYDASCVKKCVKKIKSWITTELIPLDSESESNLIEIANLMALFKETEVLTLLFPFFTSKCLTDVQFKKLNSQFKDIFLYRHFVDGTRKGLVVTGTIDTALTSTSIIGNSTLIGNSTIDTSIIGNSNITGSNNYSKYCFRNTTKKRSTKKKSTTRKRH